MTQLQELLIMKINSMKQLLTIDLAQLDNETLWQIFEIYAERMTREQLKFVYDRLDSVLEFDEWLQENGLA